MESDLTAIHDIETEVYPNAWSFSFFNMMFLQKTNLFIVATEDKEILGYCVGEVERMSKTGKIIHAGHVLNVAVKQDQQHKGIGSILLGVIEKKFIENEAEVSYLEVRESNEVAQTVYTKRGYKYIKTSKGYYENEDAFIMMKPLTR